MTPRTIVGIVPVEQLRSALSAKQTLSLVDTVGDYIYFRPTAPKQDLNWLGYVDAKPARLEVSVCSNQSIIWY